VGLNNEICCKIRQTVIRATQRNKFVEAHVLLEEDQQNLM